jgi:hypothetical protein
MSNSSPPGDTRGSVDQKIGALADGQHGVVSHVQLRIGLGLPEGQIRYRLEVGRLHRIEQCAYAVGRRSVTTKGRWLACVFTCGAGARLGYRSAAALWGIAPYSGPLIDVIAPRRRRSRRNLVVHTARLDPLDVTIEDAIPVTTVARTLIDLSAIADVRRIERALTRAEKLELFDLRSIEAACARAYGHRGLKNLNQALSLYVPDGATRSDFEGDLVHLCRDYDLPQPLINSIVEGYEVDAWWPGTRLIIELDSWEHHRDRAAFERDRIRDAKLVQAGYIVVRVTWRRLHDQPEEVASLIHQHVCHLMANSSP